MNQDKKSVGLVTLRMASEYGIAISQAGTPIKFADDYQKIIDTRWRPLGTAVAYKVDFSIDSPAGLFKIFDHGMGFIPAIEAPRQTDRLSPSPQFSPIGSVQFVADDTSVYIAKGSTTFSRKTTAKGYIYVYDFPINEPFDSQYKGVAMGTTTKTDRGMKINGNSEHSYNRLQDDSNFGFAVNTNNKQINVAKVDQITFTPSVGVNTVVISHDIPYPPLIKISQKLGPTSIQDGLGGYVQFPKETWSALSLADSNSYANAGTQYKISVAISNLLAGQSATIGYVLFRDPSEIAG